MRLKTNLLMRVVLYVLLISHIMQDLLFKARARMGGQLVLYISIDHTL